MCAECDRMEADENSGRLIDVAARAMARHIASAFEPTRDYQRSIDWATFVTCARAMALGHAPGKLVTAALKEDN